MPARESALLEGLLRAGSGDENVIRDLIDEHGFAHVANVLIDEIVFRCETPVNCGLVFIQVDLTHFDKRASYVLRASDGTPVELVDSDSHFDVGMALEYELVDLVREVCGPYTGRDAGLAGAKLVPEVQAGQSSELPTIDDVRRIARATNVVVTATSSQAPALDKLALSYGSDKWGGIHWFTPHYERHFLALRDKVVRVLEIGVGGYDGVTPGGGSLKMWKRYFNRGFIYGTDIFDKSYCDEPRIRTLQGSQDDPEFMREIAQKYGPFDIIIDDGSHINKHVRAAFQTLFPYLRNGGFYVIEDLWTAYWPGYGGDPKPQEDTATSMALVKNILDIIHYEEKPEPDADEKSLGKELAGLHLYHNIVFLEKGKNEEGGIPRWIPREPFWSADDR